MLILVASQPTGAAFDVVLLLHVVAAVVAIGTVVASGVAGGRVLAARTAPLPGGVVRYFAPGVNWAGRILYAVPVLGAAVLGLSRGQDHLGDSWLLAGIGLWVAAAALAEGVLWPAERRVQVAVAAAGASSGQAGGRAVAVGAEARTAARRVCWSSAGVLAVLLAAMVVMVAKP